MFYYTGIGSRNTPPYILSVMASLAHRLPVFGFILRSGGAHGADQAFETGARMGEGKYDIYLPWPEFNNNPSQLFKIDNNAMDLAKTFHPAWDKCSGGARKLHARNGYQVMGPTLLSPSEFVICWTPEGKGTGGTGQAIRIAEHFGIPVYDFGKCSDYNELDEMYNAIIAHARRIYECHANKTPCEVRASSDDNTCAHYPDTAELDVT